jgi:LysM repeat protein
MSLLAQLHDLKLALDQFRPSLDMTPDEEQRIAHTAAKLIAMMDVTGTRSRGGAGTQRADEETPETLLSIARQYGVRVSDLRKHNAHLQHFEDTEPLPRNTPVKIKGGGGGSGAVAMRGGSSTSSPRNSDRARSTPGVPLHQQLLTDRSAPMITNNTKVVFDTIRSIARDQNVTVDALISANRVLARYDLDEPLPQDLDIVIPTNVPPAQRTYVLTFAGETIRSVSESVAHCRPEDLMASNPQLGNIGLDTRLPEGTRIALPR